MKNNSIIVFFAILILANLVYGQSGGATTTPSPTVTTVPTASTPAPSNAIDTCIKNFCSSYAVNSTEYQDCRAKCAGVPNPNPSVVNATNECVAKCDKTDNEAYKTCQQNCINSIYYTSSPVFNSPKPTNTGGGATNTGGSTDKGTDAPSTDTATPSPTSSASFVSVNLYPLMLLAICLVAGIFGVGL